ncbi:MAG TPA: histidine phosphatase family protein [Planctomycetaceae bacterium]|jgi:phosphohistidine phosphatase|nr:histidine phosphatase family protein [Planctomycetaceae bacterium]
MQVWLVRHAVAAERDEFEGPDAQRPLTAKGKKQFRDFARWLAREATPPDVLVTSPLVRAVETAEILRKALGFKKKDLVHSDALSPGAEPERLLELARQAAVGTVAFVGHEPDLSRALSEFIGGGEFAFGKGFAAAVEFVDAPVLGRGQLCWFVGPRMKTKAPAEVVAVKE